MKKIGIISDTHGMLRPEVLECLQGCECIFHGGDINKQSVLDELEKIAPVLVVRGNNDKEWAEDIPAMLTTESGGLRVFMVHNKKHIPGDLADVDLVIYGHSHKYEDKVIDGVRYLNPGSCGPRRFNQEITLAILTFQDDDSYEIEKIMIPHQDKKHLNEKMSDNKMPVDIGEKMYGLMKDIDAGKSAKQLARKHRISEDLADEIMRMYLQHPGVDVDGMLRRMGL